MTTSTNYVPHYVLDQSAEPVRSFFAIKYTNGNRPPNSPIGYYVLGGVARYDDSKMPKLWRQVILDSGLGGQLGAPATIVYDPFNDRAIIKGRTWGQTAPEPPITLIGDDLVWVREKCRPRLMVDKPGPKERMLCRFHGHTWRFGADRAAQPYKLCICCGLQSPDVDPLKSMRRVQRLILWTPILGLYYWLFKFDHGTGELGFNAWDQFIAVLCILGGGVGALVAHLMSGDEFEAAAMIGCIMVLVPIIASWFRYSRLQPRRFSYLMAILLLLPFGLLYAGLRYGAVIPRIF